jgi:glutamine amidotransferase
MEKKVVIIDYGAGNVQSVRYAFERLGVAVILSDNKEEILSASHVIFPGVGHAKYAMNALRQKDLVELIPTLKQPVLGICLGMQLLCSHTQEGDTKGLGIFDVPVLKFDDALRVPHMGWNSLFNGKELLENVDQQVYFVHSYFVPECAESMALCDYHGKFSAALRKDNFYGCQFHPEKSGSIGAEILERFLQL